MVRPSRETPLPDRRWLGLALIGLLAGAVVGLPPGNDTPAAATHPPCVLFDRDGLAICGGLCLAHGVVLTAAHCVERGLSVVRQMSSDGQYHYSRVSGAKPHPQFIGLHGERGMVAYDVATLNLTAVTPSVAAEAHSLGASPIRVASPGLGALVQVSGFARQRGDLVPRMLRGRVSAAGPFEFVVQPAPPGSRAHEAACHGDSGTPVWSVDGRHLIGLVSRLQEPAAGCQGGFIASRVDAHLAFLQLPLVHR